MRSWIDLRARLGLVMVFVLLPAMAYILVTSVRERDRARGQAQADLLSLARLAGNTQQQSLEEMQRVLALVATLAQVRDAAQTGDPAACNARLAQIGAVYPQSIGFGVWNLKGEAICADRPATGPTNAAARLWFRQVLATQAFALGDFELGSATSGPIIAFGYPVSSTAGELVAVVSSGLDLNHLTGTTSPLPLPPDSLVTEFDQHGLVLVRSQNAAAWIGKPRIEAPGLETGLAAGNPVLELIGSDGVRRVYAVTPVIGPGSSLVGLSIGRPSVAVFGPSDIAFATGLAISGSLAVLALGLAGWWSRQTIVRPMQSLMTATDRLTHGELSARAKPEPAGSEVDRLATAVNAMASSLEQREAESQAAAESLRQSEERFRVLADNAPNMIWIAALDGTLTYVNARWLEYVGLMPEQKAHSWPELVLHPDDYPRYLAQWNQALREGTAYDSEVRHRRHDGIYRWFLTRAVPVRAASGAMAVWFGTSTDIHEQKLAADRTSCLQAVAGALSLAIAPAQVVEVIVTQGASVLGALSGILMLISADGRGLELAGCYNVPEGIQHYMQRVPLGAETQSAEAARRGEPVWIETAAEFRERYPLTAYWVDLLKFDSAAAVPLRYEGRILGVLGLSFAQAQIFTPDNQSFLQALAQQCAQALERARLYEAERQARQTADQASQQAQESQARAAQLEAVTAGLSQAVTPADVMHVILHQGAGAVGATAATLLLLSEDGAWLRRAAGVGYSDQISRLFQQYPVTSPLPSADVVRTGEAVWIESAVAYRARYPQLTEVINSTDYEAAAAVPLRYAGRLTGVLALSFSNTLMFRSEIQTYIFTLASYCAHALERARLYAETQRLIGELEARAIERTAQLERSVEQLRGLAARLLSVRDAERRRLALELHDELGAALASFKISLAKIQSGQRAQVENVAAELAELSANIDGTLQTLHRITNELRSGVINDLGLLAVFDWLVQDFQDRTGIESSLVMDVEDVLIDSKPGTVIIRVLQESLTNMARLAQITKVTVGVTQQPGRLVLQVDANGLGFDPSAPGPERWMGVRDLVNAVAGQVEIQSAPGHDTRIVLTIPLRR